MSKICIPCRAIITLLYFTNDIGATCTVERGGLHACGLHVVTVSLRRDIADWSRSGDLMLVSRVLSLNFQGLSRSAQRFLLSQVLPLLLRSLD